MRYFSSPESFSEPGGRGVVGEAPNPRGEAGAVLLRRSFQLFGRRGLDQKAIACHAASCPSVLPRTTKRAPSRGAQKWTDLQRLRRASAVRPHSPTRKDYGRYGPP